MAQQSKINNGPFFWEMTGVKKDGSPRPSHLVAANHVGEGQRIYVTDSATGGKIIDLLFALNREHDTTLVLVTHDDTLSERCDRRILLQDGCIVRPLTEA